MHVCLRALVHVTVPSSSDALIVSHIVSLTTAGCNGCCVYVTRHAELDPRMIMLTGTFSQVSLHTVRKLSHRPTDIARHSILTVHYLLLLLLLACLAHAVFADLRCR